MNECVFIYRTYHIVSQGGLQFYLSENGRQLAILALQGIGANSALDFGASGFFKNKSQRTNRDFCLESAQLYLNFVKCSLKINHSCIACSFS